MVVVFFAINKWSKTRLDKEVIYADKEIQSEERRGKAQWPPGQAALATAETCCRKATNSTFALVRSR
jgi:hypothetical protein